MKTVVVTGATGQDGSYMIEYLLENTQHNILAAVRRTSQFIDSNLKESLKNPRVRVVNFDLLDPYSIETLVKEEKPDYFINFGAQTFVADSWKAPVLHMQTNAMGSLYILEAIKNHAPKCHGYLAGSSEELGNVEYSPQDEKHPLKPRSPYGVSKAASRLLAKVYRESYGIYVVQGILFNHDSKKRQEYFVTRKITKGVGRIVNAIKNNEPFKPIELGNLDAKRDLSHAKDVVDGVWKMLNQPTPKDYVLSSGQTHSVREFVQKAFDIANIPGAWHGQGLNEEYSIANDILEEHPVKSSILVRVNPQFYRPAEVDLLLGDSSLARKELGWAPKISFDELVREMVEWDIAGAK